MRTASREDANEPLERELVAIGAEAGDAADAGARDARPVAKGLARVGVREVHLDAGEGDGRERVEDRDRRVRVRAGVEDEARERRRRATRRSSRRSSPRDSSAALDLDAERGGAPLEARVDLGERRRGRRRPARACRAAAGSGRRCRGCARPRRCLAMGKSPEDRPPGVAPCERARCAVIRARRGASAPRFSSSIGPCPGCRRAEVRARGNTSR